MEQNSGRTDARAMAAGFAPEKRAGLRQRPWLLRVFWLWQDRGLRYVFRRAMLRLRAR